MRLVRLALALLLWSVSPAFGAPGDLEGWGKSSAAPRGDPFDLPAGIVLTTPVDAYNPFEFECKPREGEPESRGSGGNALCLTFSNTTDRPITFTLPPGLVFISEKLEFQNVILVNSETFEVRPHEVYSAVLYLHCINADRTPVLPGSRYRLGPIAKNTELRKLLAILDGRQVPLAPPHVQLALEEIQKDGGIRAETLASLKAAAAQW